MVRKARSTSFGSWKSSSRTSTSTTSGPNERNAFETPRPVASETSRSEPGPPIRIAIFFGNALPFCRLFAFIWLIVSHNFHFRLQLDPALCARDAFNVLDQLQHVGRCCAAVVYNEIAVYFGHTRISYTRILQSQFIHQFSRWNTVGVLKNATCALGDWLCRTPFLLRFAQATIDLCALGRLRAKCRRNCKILFQQRASPVKNLQRIPIFHVRIAFGVAVKKAHHLSASLGSKCSRRHPSPAAHCVWNSLQRSA